MYGLQYSLILRLSSDDDAILKTDDNENDIYKVVDGKLMISNLL